MRDKEFILCGLKTAVGDTEPFVLNDIVRQGSVYGPQICIPPLFPTFPLVSQLFFRFSSLHSYSFTFHTFPHYRPLFNNFHPLSQRSTFSTSPLFYLPNDWYAVRIRWQWSGFGSTAYTYFKLTPMSLIQPALLPWPEINELKLIS